MRQFNNALILLFLIEKPCPIYPVLIPYHDINERFIYERYFIRWK